MKLLNISAQGRMTSEQEHDERRASFLHEQFWGWSAVETTKQRTKAGSSSDAVQAFTFLLSQFPFAFASRRFANMPLRDLYGYMDSRFCYLMEWW